MIRVLIVDDEVYSRKSIRLLGEWDRYDMAIVGEARNGEEALALSEELNPGLMIIDMNMPIIDGVALLRHMRLMPCKFIIVSGHDDFHYTKEAIAHRVVDYLLKPITRAELNAALRKAAEEIRDKVVSERDKHLRDLLGQMLTADEFNKGRLSADIEKTDGEGWGDSELVYVIILDYRKHLERFGGDANLFSFIMANALTELYAPYGQPAVIHSPIGKSEFVVILKSLVPEVTIDMQTVQTDIRESLGVRCEIIASLPMNHPIQIPGTYKRLQQTLMQKSYVRLTDHPTSQSTGETVVYPYHEMLREFGFALHHGSRDKCSLIIDQWIYVCRTQPNITLQQVYAEYLEWMRVIKAVYQKLDMEEGMFDWIPIHKEAFLEIALSPNGIADQLLMAVDQIVTINSDQDKNNAIDYVADYLRDHYHQDISLTELSRRFHYSKGYLCKIFKERYQCTLNEFVTTIRMVKAKALIVEQGYLVQEAAELVGITNFSYFSKLYKKHHGHPPSEDVAQAIGSLTRK